MRPAGDSLPVLTYHSISKEPGPTSIASETFRMQMRVLAEEGFRTVDTDTFLAWHEHGTQEGNAVLITFDDAFADFADAAHPILAASDFGCIVFVPTGHAGAQEAWRGANACARRLLDWPAMRELALHGVEFGGHGVGHADLTRLSPAERRQEIDGSARALAQHLGAKPRAFAAPYGRVNAAVLADLARTYEIAFGTRFDRARRSSPRLDLPRVEMHYFREERRWRDFLRGADAYFAARRTLRAVRHAALAVAGMAGAGEST